METGFTEPVSDATGFLILAVTAIASYAVFHRALLRAIRRSFVSTESDWDNRLVRHHVFERLSHLVPGSSSMCSRRSASPRLA